MEKFFGMYRSRVIDNKDPEMFGRVKIQIPDLMPEILDDDTKGLWARPANNPIGGRNVEGDDQNLYSGSCLIPPKGSWTWIFFENGNPNRPYYFGALDLENAKVLPENQLGENYEQKWTILKTNKGRTIIISDDPDDERIELTGKKKNISEPPSGDINSVYEIDGNQTSILFDERNGKEKILIRTHKGDFFHIDIDEQKLQMYFKEDILIQTDATFHLKAKEIKVEADDSINLKSTDLKSESINNANIKAKNVRIKGDNNVICEGVKGFYGKGGISLNMESGAAINVKGGAAANVQGGASVNILAGAICAIKGSAVAIMGPAMPAMSSKGASTNQPQTPDTPVGDRDT